jgi:arylsulfatase A-like enzyme
MVQKQALKGWKGNEFEGWAARPIIISWPDKIKQIKFDGLTSSLDILVPH